MDRSAVAIVIPALNEEQTIAQVVGAALRWGLPIVIDDGSVDRTRELAVAAGAVVVSHSTSRGYDSALDTGFRQARGMNCLYVVTLDADGQHDTAAISRILELLEGGASVVVGIRDARQRWTETLFSILAWARFRIRDPLCGLKGYRISAYEKLGHFDSYASIGTELTLFAASRGMALAQLPIVTRQRSGAPRFGSSVPANWRILKAILRSLPRYFF